MSSKARRLDESAIQPFDWADDSAPRPRPKAVPSPKASASASEPLDVGAHAAHLAALERDAFSKGYAQGERAGAEAAGKRGEVMLRRLTDTINELTTLREQMIHHTERQMV